MQYKLYKPPASQLGGTSNSYSFKPHFYFLKVLAGSLREGLQSGRFSPWSNWKCLQTFGKAATVRGGTGLWAAAWEISAAERKKRNGTSSALLLLETGESSLMHFFQEHFGGCFRSSVTVCSRRFYSPSTGRKGISTAFSKVLAIPILRQAKQIGDAKQICSQSIWLNSVCLPLLSLALHQTHTSDISAFTPCLQQP